MATIGALGKRFACRGPERARRWMAPFIPTPTGAVPVEPGEGLAGGVFGGERGGARLAGLVGGAGVVGVGFELAHLPGPGAAGVEEVVLISVGGGLPVRAPVAEAAAVQAGGRLAHGGACVGFGAGGEEQEEDRHGDYWKAMA